MPAIRQPHRRRFRGKLPARPAAGGMDVPGKHPAPAALLVLLCVAGRAAAQQVVFDQQSEPPGFISITASLESGTNASTTVAPLESTGYRFMEWLLNGTRKSDPLGQALNPVAFQIYEPTYAVARYTNSTADADSDGIPDWFEIYTYADVDEDAGSDTDSDGLNLDVEHRLDFNPLLFDTFSGSGVSRRRSAGTLLIFSTNWSVYVEKSLPPGFADRALAVSNGATAFTANLHGDSAGFTFAYWDMNGAIQTDITGQALCIGSMVVTGATTATAHYFPTGEDTDSDDLPDWWEWQNFQSLALSSTNDPDGNGMTLDVDFRHDNHPGLREARVGGGVSRRDSAVTLVNLAGFCAYDIYSAPPGFVTRQSGVVLTGTVVRTPNLNGVNAGYMFTGWRVNGERQADISGRALSVVDMVVTSDVAAVADYVDANADADGDKLPDWWELLCVGNLALGPSDDPDGDGLNLDVEYRLDGNPGIDETFAGGGVSRRRSGVEILDMQFFERTEYVRCDGVVTRFFSPAPPAVAGMAFGGNTAPALGDWDGDGDVDLFVAASNGQMTVYENTGSRYAMNLADRTAGFSDLAGAWNGQADPAPALGDWDGDGCADLVVGGSSGTVRIVSGTGGFSAPQVPDVSYDLVVNGASLVVPALGDLTGDGLPDLAVLTGDGFVRLYTNTGSASVPFDAGMYGEDLLGQNIPGGTCIVVADSNRDGIEDVLVSDREGRVWEFRGLPAGGFALKTKVWGGTGKGFASRLTLAVADLDGDADLDGICGFAEGGLVCLRDPRLGAPTGLRAVGGAESVALDWDPNREYRIKGYSVYRGVDTNLFGRITTFWLVDPLYLDWAVQVGTTYFYRVTSMTHAFLPGSTVAIPRESRPSETASATAGRVMLSLSDSAGMPGTGTVMSVNIGNARGLVGNGLEIRIAYDPAVIRPATQIWPTAPTVVRAAPSQAIGITDNGAVADGTLVIQGSGACEIAGEGRMLDVNFRVNDGVAPGAKTTNVITLATFKDSSGRDMQVEIGAGGVLTVGAVYGRGDVTGDGAVDWADLDLAIKLAAGTRPPTADELKAADLNGNDKLDHGDAHLILRLIGNKGVNP